MDQKISIKIAERTFNLTAPSPEKEEIIRLAADAINQHLQAYTRRYPGKSQAELMPMLALNECVSRITAQREKAALEAEAQQLGKDKGFGKHDEYQSQQTGLDGSGYLSAQNIWKEAKDGGQPIIAVFVADISGSMEGTPILSLKESLLATKDYIGSDNYIGLVSYATNVHVDLPVKKFDAEQKAYFSGAVKALTVEDATATYDAVLTGLQMLEEKAKEVPDAKLMLFLLTDGDQNEGYTLDRITGIVGGLQVPIYSIAYNYDNTGELEKLSNINEAAFIKADSDDIANQLRNLFNVQI